MGQRWKSAHKNLGIVEPGLNGPKQNNSAEVGGCTYCRACGLGNEPGEAAERGLEGAGEGQMPRDTSMDTIDF